jgi:hypothetical protein
MARIESSIEAIWKKVPDFEKQWMINYTIPYIKAYHIAFDNFNNVKMAQDRKDQALLQYKIDLSVTALTICGGSVLAAVLGEIVLNKVSHEVVLDTLCKQSMNDIFTKANLSLGNLSIANRILEFAVGKVREQIKTIANQEARDIFKNDHLGGSIQQSFIEKPYTKKAIMEQFLAKNFLYTRAACQTLLEATVSKQEKESMYNVLNQSNFSNPPKFLVLPANYYEYIEMTFY